MKENIIKFLICGFAAGCVGISPYQNYAQNPAPGTVQSQPMVVSGGTIVTGTGQVFEKGTLIFEKGKLTYVGNFTQNVPTGAKIIDAGGKYVYPGLISPYSQAGLTEIEAVRTTSDVAEIGDFNPNIRALVAHNTDSEIIPTIRGNGVLIGQTVPLGGLISGQSSVMYYDGWNWEDAVLKSDDGIWFNWPAVMSYQFDPATFSRTLKKNDKYAEQVQKIHDYLAGAVAYKENASNATANVKFEALKGLFDGSKRAFLTAEDGKQVVEAITLFKKLGIQKIVLVGGMNAELAFPLLKKYEIPVLVPGTHRLPATADAPVWSAYELPKKLVDAGLLVGMFYNASYWRTRNIGFNAGNTAAFGLDKNTALQLVTLNNAKILGIDKEVGSLEAGKHATFIITEGDILDMKNAKVTEAYIRGMRVSLDDKQKRLYEKYQSKYGIN